MIPQGDHNDRSRKHLENIRRTFEVQTGSKKGNDAERNINYDDRRGTRQRFEQRNIGSVEKRTIEDIIETEKFSKISIFIGNELSRDNILQLALQYKGDSRVTEENFEIIDVIAYDMLSDDNNAYIVDSPSRMTKKVVRDVFLLLEITAKRCYNITV